jgi:hypothetical protein
LSQLGALATLLFPSTARADPYPTVGFFFGYAFGERPSVEWGFQASFVELTTGTRDCYEYDARTGFGPFAQVGLLGWSRPRLTLGVFAGTEIEPGAPSVLGELGGSLRFDGGAKVGLHTGEIFEASWPFLYARQEWFLGEYPLGVGANVVPTLGLFDDCNVQRGSVGRPRRDADGATIEPAAHRRDAFGLTDDARAWIRDAEMECAAIGAFLELARELLALGAPLELVRRALDAAEDEVRHAAICSAVATRMGAGPFRPRADGDSIRPALQRRAHLERLAVESFIDGCLGEGVAAERARFAAASSQDPLLRAAHRRIATDEARHAELGWDIVQWSLGAGGSPTRRALAECLRGDFGDPRRNRVGAHARARLRRELAAVT